MSFEQSREYCRPVMTGRTDLPLIQQAHPTGRDRSECKSSSTSEHGRPVMTGQAILDSFQRAWPTGHDRSDLSSMYSAFMADRSRPVGCLQFVLLSFFSPLFFFFLFSLFSLPSISFILHPIALRSALLVLNWMKSALIPIITKHVLSGPLNHENHANHVV